MAYTKLDHGITDSTIWQAPDATRLVWITLLAMADQNGYIGASMPGLAGRARVALADCVAAVELLESPDEWSRTKDHEGRRIAPADGGWVLLNHAKYRAMQSADDRRERSRVAMAELRAKRKHAQTSVNGLQSLTKLALGSSKLSQEEAYTEEEEEKEISKLSLASPRPSDDDPPLAAANSNLNGTEHPKINGKTHPKAGPPDCPHIEVLALWAEVLPHLPQHDPEQWRGARADHLRARWRETAVAKHWADKAQGVEYFRRLFGYVGQSPFLTGHVKPREPGKRPFLVELEWLVVAGNWAKVVEGKYHPEENMA